MKHTVKLTDNDRILWEGEYTEIAVGYKPKGALIYALFKGEDEWPLLLCSTPGPSRGQDPQPVRELSGKECDLIQAEGAVTHVLMRHPRASRHGHPICAANSEGIWKGTVGNLGFQVASNLELICDDSGDDSPESYRLTILVSETLAATLEATTKAAQEAYDLATGSTANPERTHHPLAEATMEMADEETSKLVTLAEGLQKKLEDSRERDVDTASWLDDTRGFLAARAVIEKETQA
jgi:hypothetical protein